MVTQNRNRSVQTNAQRRIALNSEQLCITLPDGQEIIIRPLCSQDGFIKLQMLFPRGSSLSDQPLDPKVDPLAAVRYRQ